MNFMENGDNPGVHYFDVIGDHPGDIDYFALSSAYKLACEKKELQLLPAPFGLRGPCPKDTTIQIVILTRPDMPASWSISPSLTNWRLLSSKNWPMERFSSLNSWCPIPRTGEKFCNIAWRIWEGGSLDAMSSPPKQFAKVAQSLPFHSRTKIRQSHSARRSVAHRSVGFLSQLCIFIAWLYI